MTQALRIGDPVQVHAETEVLTLISVDGADAWCRDGAGGHVQYRLEDLERARSRPIRWGEVAATIEPMWPSVMWTSRGRRP